jgi:hypothetical protein
MDTAALITETKARFAHNSAKAYLAEKYESKLIVAEQNGLWKADMQTISMLSSFLSIKNVVLIDTFGNPVKVNREELLKKLKEVYLNVMSEWHQEWHELESKR